MSDNACVLRLWLWLWLQRDLDAWIGSGMTCLENGGMTHPIRLISFLIAQEHNASYHRLAEQALNGKVVYS